MNNINQEEEIYCELKVTFVGDAGVGKTSIIDQLINHKFSQEVPSTIGGGNFIKLLTMLIHFDWKNKTVIENGNKKLILMKNSDILEFKKFIRTMDPKLQKRTVSFIPFNKRANIRYLKENRPISGFLDPYKAIHLNIPNIDDPPVVGDMNRISY